MKQKQPVLKCVCFLVLLVCFFFAADLLIHSVFGSFFRRSGRFNLDDFEITQRDHPDREWDRVFFGSSVVIAGYREEESTSGYVNLGIDDGTVRDLWEMIDKGYLHVRCELVIGLNELTLYDGFPTNPNYIWHKEWYEPYVLFRGVRFQTLITQTADELISHTPRTFPYLGQQKNYYWGVMSQAQLEEKLHSERYEKYLHLTAEDYAENFEALDKIISWAKENGVRVRIVEMPTNPAAGISESKVVMDRMLKEFCSARGIELLDLQTTFDAECFYDIGHLNREYGSHLFTKEIDPWLNQ